ncbi:carbohydrate ABC transporter permease [Bauldia sp.]|uniref:carbohydrate ABC transporter permease n=1 Tax=Bauldia sp. TaxID=2575872 RepID=UPI003BAD5783
MIRTVILGLCLVWFIFTVFPLYWTLITSFKPPQAVSGGATYLPWVDFTPTLKAYIDTATGVRGNFFQPVLHSAIISISATIVSVLFGSMAAYALVRFTFRVRLLSGIIFAVIAIGGFVWLTEGFDFSPSAALGAVFVIAVPVAVLVNRLPLPGPTLGNEDVLFWFVSQRMFPPIVAAFALFLFYSELGQEGFKTLDTYHGMVLAYTSFSLPIVIWLMRDFFQSLPLEIEEAALVDDVPRLRIFFEIVLPMSRAGLIAVSIITVGFVWNEFLFALLLTTSDWQTLPIMLAGQNSVRGDEWWAVAVAAMVALVPMIVLAGLLARLMRSGLVIGAIK